MPSLTPCSLKGIEEHNLTTATTFRGKQLLLDKATNKNMN